jgi:hypothetical protein
MVTAVLRYSSQLELDFYKRYASNFNFRQKFDANISGFLTSGSGLLQLRF